MRIIDTNGIEITEPDFAYGYYVEDQIIIAHHPAQPYIPEQYHYEVIKEYPNGGKDVKKIIDVPGQEAKDAWDEVENILRWHWYPDGVRPASGLMTSKNILKGEYFTVQDRLFLAITNIPIGSSILIDINCIETNIAAALNALNQ